MNGRKLNGTYGNCRTAAGIVDGFDGRPFSGIRIGIRAGSGFCVRFDDVKAIFARRLDALSVAFGERQIAGTRLHLAGHAVHILSVEGAGGGGEGRKAGLRGFGVLEDGMQPKAMLRIQIVAEIKGALGVRRVLVMVLLLGLTLLLVLV